MQQLALLELFGTQSTVIPGARAKTPEAIGESLFQSLLKKEGAASTRASWDNKSDAFSGLEKELGVGGFLMGASRLPQEAAPRLTAYLEKSGVSRETIDRLVESATDKDGTVHLGRLFGRIRTETNRPGKAREELIVEAGQVPNVEKLLLDAGLGVGEVKTAMESSVNRDGDLVLGRLQKALARISSGNARVDLPLLLKGANIPFRPRKTAENLNGETVKSLIKEDPEPSLQKIKEQLAVLLRDKGIGPEEAKSFLESVSVRSLKSLAAVDEGTPWDLHGLKDLLKEAKIAGRQDWRGARETLLRAQKGQETAEDPKGAFRPADSKAASGSLKLENAPAANKAPQEVFTESVKIVQNGQGGSKETARNEMFAQPVVNQPGISTPGSNTVDSSGAASTNAPQPSPEALPKILEKMVWMAHAGRQKSRIQLSPPELGRLDVHLVVDKGRLNAHIGAESLAAKEVLDSNLTQLRQQLTQLGFVVERFEVMVGLDQQGSGRGEDLFQDRGRQGAQPRGGRRVRSVEHAVNITGRQEADRGNHQVNVLV